MMRCARTVLTVALVLLMVAPLLAAPKKGGPKKPKKARPCPAAERVERMLSGVELTDDQKGQLGEITKEFGPKLMEVMKEIAEILTPEQKKARMEASKAAKEAGKKGKEAREAVEAALKLTDEQKAKMAEVRKEMGALEKELRDKVLAVLTPEQKGQLKKARGGKKKPAK